LTQGLGGSSTTLTNGGTSGGTRSGGRSGSSATSGTYCTANTNTGNDASDHAELLVTGYLCDNL
jgi:hypothetical protein